MSSISNLGRINVVSQEGFLQTTNRYLLNPINWFVGRFNHVFDASILADASHLTLKARLKIHLFDSSTLSFLIFELYRS